MEIYTLDSLLRRITVTDLFESMIWTERWAEVGDFELVIASTRDNRSLFTTGTRIAINESYRVMTIEEVEDSTSDDGSATLTIRGRSIEQVLEDRAAWTTASALSTITIGGTKEVKKWVLTGTPGNIARQMFNSVCRTGSLNAYDTIPLLQTGSIFPVDTIGEPVDSITWEIEPGKSLYDAIKELCDIYELGFRLVRNADTSQLYFDIYSGTNRTTRQDDFAAVVFSKDLDNLQNTKTLDSITDYKNVAYVWNEQGFQIVYAAGAEPETAGLDRRAIQLVVDNLTDPNNASRVFTTAEINAYLQQKGVDELARHQAWSAFDGEHSKSSGYIYGVHYNLGDLVEMRNTDGASNNMRVTEQIFASDEQGDRSYPTLAINLSITPGSWLGWDYNQVWSDLSADTLSVWANQV